MTGSCPVGSGAKNSSMDYMSQEQGNIINMTSIYGTVTYLLCIAEYIGENTYKKEGTRFQWKL
ncbi:unnamed protein product [marine sediment metagenome]|uniref:Uncharacterized protein n=1 Tax=marine sediment metagenome TaxID=412755 RepID=X0TY69_9ZZZZ